MEYRTQKILLTGNIDDETEAYLLWLVGQSNSLHNSVLNLARNPRNISFQEEELLGVLIKVNLVCFALML